MRRRIAIAALLLLMLGHPTSAMAGQERVKDQPRGLATLPDRFVPDPVDERAGQDKLIRGLMAEDHEVGGLARF